MEIIKITAIIYAAVTAGVVAFQLALVAGAPWGAYAMGGASPGRFSPAMRISALIQAALLAGMAAVVLAHAGLILPAWQEASRWLVWAAAAILGLSLALNLSSRSTGERRIWLPTLAILLLSCLAVALSGVF
jgi:uncharacterized membrane protein